MLRLLPILLLLAACNAPGPHFGGVPAKRVRVGEMVFDVRVRDTLAEAMRVDPQWAPRLSGVAGPAAAAMAYVSGCRVTEIRGDQALVLGLLDCGGWGEARPRRPVTTGLDCYKIDKWRSEGLQQTTLVLDCELLP